MESSSITLRAASAAGLVTALILLNACVSPTDPTKQDDPNEDTGTHDRTGMIMPSDVGAEPGESIPGLHFTRPLA